MTRRAAPALLALGALAAACGGSDAATIEAREPLAVAPAVVRCVVGDRVRLVATPAPSGGARYEFVSYGDVIRVAPDPARGTATVGCAAIGTAAVTVTNVAGEFVVPVTVAAAPAPGPVLGVDVEPSAIALVAGAEWRLAARARVRDSVASTAVRWATLDTAVAVVDATGLVRAVGAGATRIAATAAADPSAQTLVDVTVARGSAVVQSVFAEPSVSIIVLGDTVRLRGFVGLAPGAPPGTSRDVTFSTVDTLFATVSTTGLVRGRRPGIARIIVSPAAAPALRFTAFVAVREPAVP